MENRSDDVGGRQRCTRQAIEETLRRLQDEAQAQCAQEARRREEENEFTRSVIKVMQLDSKDHAKILVHAQNVTQQNEITSILDCIKGLEQTYQLEKKRLASIHDKKARHERVQQEKTKRDDAVAPLRMRLTQLDSSIRPILSPSLHAGVQPVATAQNSNLPAVVKQEKHTRLLGRKKSTPPNYRQVMELIQKTQRERKSLLDPYMANLKLARLWESVNDHDRSLEDYYKACKSLSDEQLMNIPADELADVLEKERLRKREALHFLFMRSLQLKERIEIAEIMSKYLDLSTTAERPSTVAYLESILRKQDYIEDRTLSTPEAVTTSILCFNSLGPLTDLRFQLLQEMLAASPNDPYLIDAVENMHVRKREYGPAKALSDRFVKLPEVRRASLFTGLAAFHLIAPPPLHTALTSLVRSSQKNRTGRRERMSVRRRKTKFGADPPLSPGASAAPSAATPPFPAGMPLAAALRQQSNDFIVRDGRILLTPVARVSESPLSYEELSTPNLAGSTAFRKPGRGPPSQRYASSSHRSFASNRQLGASNLYDTRSQAASEKKRGLSYRAIQALQILADMVFAVCLLVAVGARANFVSLYYLLVFCYGVVQSFQSKPAALSTLVVSVLACVAHGVFIYMFEKHPDTARDWTRGSTASLFGFDEEHSATEYLGSIGVDALVVCSSAIHYFYVLGRLQVHKQHFDLFEMGGNFLNDATPSHYRKAAMLKWMEILCGVLLFLTAMSIPAFATGVYYLIILQRLINWTFFTKKVTIAQLIYQDASGRSRVHFLGPSVTKLVIVVSFVIINWWYIFQFSEVNDNKTVKKIAKYAGLVDFRASHVEWSYYLFASCQFLLFVCCAKLYNLHADIAKDGDVFHLSEAPSPKEAVELIGLDPSGTTSLLQPSDRIDRSSSVDIHYLLSKQSFMVRTFLQEGGLLLASAAAIVWCVSYPSYASLPFIAWAFMSLGLYGLSSPPMVIWVLILYGTCLSLVEYFSNLTGDFLKSDYTIYGLKKFDYPFLDLCVHNICLVFIYYSIRTRWQYQDVIKEYRRQRDLIQLKSAKSVDDSGVLNEEERSSMADFRIQADLRNQMKLGWGKVIEFWILDAKQVIFTHLDALVLLTILAVALSTSVSFLQVGYLVLAVLLMLFFEHRRRFWRVLLFYSLGACLAVFVRNIDCGGDVDLELIGLICYSPTSDTWGSLWPTLFSAQLLIIFQLVFQLVIYVSNKETIEERIRTMNQSKHNPIFFVSRLAVEVDNLFALGGVVLCYVAFLVVAIQYEYGPSRLNTNVVGGIQLVVLFTLLGNHLGGFTSAPRTSLRLKILWSIALLIEILILVCRYVYQFKRVSSYLEKHLFTSDFMSASDFGLENHSSSDRISGVFVYLLPTAIVMALCFWQLASLMKDVHKYDFLAVGRSLMVDRIRFAFETMQQVLMLFSTTAVVVVTMWAALDEVNFIGELYVLILIGGRPLTSWKNMWFPLFWISAIALVLKYVIQLDTFNPEENGTNTLFRAGDSSDWVGMIRLPERYDPSVGASRLWKLVSKQLLVMLMCCLQRMSQYFDTAESKSKRQKKVDIDALVARFEENYARQLEEGGVARRHRTSSVQADDDEDDHVARTKTDENDDGRTGTFIFDQPSSYNPSSPGRDDPAAATSRNDEVRSSSRQKNRSARSGTLLLQQSSDIEVDRDFFSCFRDFCLDYASKASVNVVMLALTISCFLHQDIISILYMVMVYSMMYAMASSVCARWWLLATLFSIIIIAEYSVILWLPPSLDVDMQDTFPWRIVPKSHQQWYVLSDQHKWALMADFIALLTVYMLPQSNKVKNDGARTTFTTADSGYGSAHIGERSVLGSSFRSEQKAHMMIEESDYMLLTRKYLWYYLEFLFLCAWLPFLLVIVFLVGAEQGGLVSIAYLWGAVVMLYRLDEARLPSNPWIQYLRKWNWLHLFLIVLVHSPYLTEQLTKCRLISDDHVEVDDTGTVVTQSSSDGDCFSIANVLGIQLDKSPYGLIAVFVLISIQCEMLLTPAYQEVCKFVLHDRDRAPLRREEIVREFYRRRTAQWFAMKKEKSAGIQRLKIIVSKLVHKVEELMDIAMGLHYNLPPMAPTKPMIVECTQNSVTIAWEPPENTMHKIRFYRISRQQYPSMTLLGDFGDIVEIKGNTTQVTIEGLRPGTSYQFKVCAVSRMGEGPFSVASDPISTYPLNLDGSTTAGWMKYRREHVPLPRFSFLISWFQPKFLHRYVVMDKRHLVYYKNEEVALKHRSRKRRKKVKTTFMWKDVVTLRLSDKKVQFDDLSPMLYCFEVIVRQDGSKHAEKFIFQAELTKDFNKFLSALAFSVPRDAIDESIVAYLNEKNLPNPLDPANLPSPEDNNENFDEAASEWSSVTGDESSLGDAEDQEFDQSSPHGLLAWRIPLYRLLYKLQNPAFQLETVQYEMDDQYEPNLGELFRIFTNVVRSNTANICCIAMVACFAAQVCESSLHRGRICFYLADFCLLFFQADMLNMVFVLAAFNYLIVESPRPASLSWIYLLKYVRNAFALMHGNPMGMCSNDKLSCFVYLAVSIIPLQSYGVIVIRYLFQLSIFCFDMNTKGYYYPSVHPNCVAADASVTITELKSIQPMILFGLYKFDGTAIDSVTSIFDGLQWNLYVVLCIMWHRRELMTQGLWEEENADSGGNQMSFQSDAARAYRSSFASSRDSIDDAFHQDRAGDGEYHPGIVRPQRRLETSTDTTEKDDRQSRQRETLQSKSFGVMSMTSVVGPSTNANELAAEFLEEIQAQEEEEERKKAEAALAAAADKDDDDDDEIGTPPNSPPESSTSYPGSSVLRPSSSEKTSKTVSFPANIISETYASEQVEIEDSVDLDFAQRKQLSWWEKRFPRACAYFDSVICDPPPQWDKDIHIAITGEKPGRDFYTASLTVVLLSSVYAVILFEEIGEPDPNSKSTAAADTRLTSSSMLSAYLVLLVLLEVCFIIWDRVAYVCRSLKSKLVLQYTYAVLLHLCVWWLIPLHSHIYFQQRPLLVFFYLQHCVYLWLGALQVRYGYPAFKGSKYNYTTETVYTKVNETLFPLVMAAPFLFEMRALLDYVCTKTSLSWSHWVLLEDTAAHLFNVKMEMQGRVEPKKAEILQGKKRQPTMGKMMSAGVMLLFLLICLVGPLALFSSANPSTTENKVTLTDVVVGVTDSQGTLSSLYTNSDINSPKFKISRNTDGAAVQRVEFDTFSRDIWTTSPPRVNQLVSQLQSTEALNWTIAFTFERPGPADNQEVKITYLAPMSDDHRNELIPMIKQNVDDSDATVAIDPIKIKDLFPPIIQLTATDGILNRSTTMRSINITKHTQEGVSWWDVRPANSSTFKRDDYCNVTAPFCLIVVSDNIVDGLNSLGVGSYGLTAVYVFVVVTIGSAVKGFFRGAFLQVQYSELPDPEDVLELIEGIYIAREEKYVGHLKDEVRIFETLIRVLRSPETLSKVTGTNIIHIPSAKEKID
ncbi:Piezo-type mechanosensitive ion channel component 2, partial [Globisporangium splendens]